MARSAGRRKWSCVHHGVQPLVYYFPTEAMIGARDALVKRTKDLPLRVDLQPVEKEILDATRTAKPSAS